MFLFALVFFIKENVYHKLHLLLWDFLSMQAHTKYSTGTSSGANELNHECTSTFVPLKCPELAFLESGQDEVWSAVPLFRF